MTNTEAIIEELEDVVKKMLKVKSASEAICLLMESAIDDVEEDLDNRKEMNHTIGIIIGMRGGEAAIESAVGFINQRIDELRKSRTGETVEAGADSENGTN
jgi:hypothetical protein